MDESDAEGRLLSKGACAQRFEQALDASFAKGILVRQPNKNDRLGRLFLFAIYRKGFEAAKIASFVRQDKRGFCCPKRLNVV
ncbi:MAG: hypothetical protein IKS90_03275 [Clostridia bacterium]|nr:hypothetical protein [Clostridia bacterium]